MTTLGPFSAACEACPICPACWIPARAVVHVLARARVFSAAQFEALEKQYSEERHSVVSQIDVGDRCPQLPEPEEQILRRVAVAPARLALDLLVVVPIRDLAAARYLIEPAE